MGKHKNKVQNSIFLDFMENHADIAKGFTKRDKPNENNLWEQLTASLNSAGPPQKNVAGWKKLWTEWKSEIKKKMAHNQIEARATGGGPFSKYQLTPTEETIVRICGMKRSVEGVLGISLGQQEEPAPDILFSESVEVGAEISLCCNDDTGRSNGEEMPLTSSKQALESPLFGSAPKVPRLKSTAERLKEFMDEYNERKIETNGRLGQLVQLGKENASSLRRLYRASESLSKAVNELKNEFVNAYTRIFKAMQEKHCNEIEQKQLDLQLLKFEMKNKGNIKDM